MSAGIMIKRLELLKNPLKNPLLLPISAMNQDAGSIQ